MITKGEWRHIHGSHFAAYNENCRKEDVAQCSHLTVHDECQAIVKWDFPISYLFRIIFKIAKCKILVGKNL